MMKDLEEMKKMLKEMRENLEEFVDDEDEIEEDDEETTKTGYLTGNCMICATDQGIKVSGDKAQLCTLLSKIIESLYKDAHIEKEFLQKAFDFAFMSSKDIKKELLKTIKEFLEKNTEEEDE